MSILSCILPVMIVLTPLGPFLGSIAIQRLRLSRLGDPKCRIDGW